MGTVLGYIIALLVVGGLLFLAASYTFGRGEEMAPALPDGTPVELPDDRLADGDDLRALRLSVAVRGYRMDEVDWLLDRLSEQVDTRDREIARLRSVLHVEPIEGSDSGPELLTHPLPPVVGTSDPDHTGRHARPTGARGSNGPADERHADGRPDGAAEERHAGTRSDGAGDERYADARRDAAGDEGYAGGGLDGSGDERYAGRRPRPVPDEAGRDTGARPSRPARRVRTDDTTEPE